MSTGNFVYVLGALTIVIAIFKLLLQKVSNVPDVKGGLPFFGHVITMLKGSPWDTMANWVRNNGDIYKVKIFGSNMICISDPSILKVVLSTKLRTFKKDVVWTYKPFMVLLGKGIVTSDGESWKNQRALFSNHLKYDILNEIPQMAIEAAHRLCIKLEEAKASGKTIEMAEAFRHMTLQVIAEAVLSLSPEESDRTFALMYLPIVEEGNLRTWRPEREYLLTPAWFKHRQDVARLNNYVESLIRKRWSLILQEKAQSSQSSNGNNSSNDNNKRRHDILDTCLSIFTEETFNAEAISYVRDQIKTFILAGHETSASMLTWTLYELSRDENNNDSSNNSSNNNDSNKNIDGIKNKEYRQRVLDEANIVYHGHKSKDNKKIISIPSKESIQKLTFTECCLRESLRKYSVVPTVTRLVDEDIHVTADYFIPKNSTIMINIQGVHHNPKYWPNPMTYDPTRFCGGQEIEPYTFIPFIEGPRMCLGQYLSLLESKIVLSILLSQYTFEITNKEDAGLKHSYMIPIIPKTGHFMKIHDRVK